MPLWGFFGAAAGGEEPVGQEGVAIRQEEDMLVGQGVRQCEFMIHLSVALAAFLRYPDTQEPLTLSDWLQPLQNHLLSQQTQIYSQQCTHHWSLFSQTAQ